MTIDRDDAQALYSLITACERFERMVHMRTYERALEWCRGVFVKVARLHERR